MFHPERHNILFTSLTLFNHFLGESCQTVSGSGFAKKEQNKKKFKRAIMEEALFSLTFNKCYVTWWTHFGEIMEEYLTISLRSTSRNHNNTTESFCKLNGRGVWPFSRGAIFKGASVICSLCYPWRNSPRKNKGLVEVHFI